MLEKHEATFKVVERDEHGEARIWLAVCDCRDTFTGVVYERVEDAWREHVYTWTGLNPPPYGDLTVQRWQPR